MTKAKRTKVKNVKSTVVDGIKFRSTAEGICYQLLKNNGFQCVYEPYHIQLLPPLTPKSIKIYVPQKHRHKGVKSVTFTQRIKDIEAITYTPDFVVEFDDCVVYIEVKGFPNDAYPLRYKLFMKYLNNAALQNPQKTFMFFEPHNQKQMLEMINVLKQYRNDKTTSN